MGRKGDPTKQEDALQIPLGMHARRRGRKEPFRVYVSLCHAKSLPMYCMSYLESHVTVYGSQRANLSLLILFSPFNSAQHVMKSSLLMVLCHARGAFFAAKQEKCYKTQRLRDNQAAYVATKQKRRMCTIFVALQVQLEGFLKVRHANKSSDITAN